MAVFKCKMCGGTIEFEPGASVGVCDSCGTKQTLPRLDDDRRANLYDRANHFRRNNDFDKAASIYEQILNEDPTDAEAYWSLVLCRYGIEYVEDPATRRRVPTVNRAQYTSIFDDADYQSALKNADAYQRAIYEAEANAINELQKGILAISQKEEPFDVFICYKETDAQGRRTPDSVLANDLYHQLTQEGFKVFFSRITLEDKLGTAYEPYIFAALNSAKVMVVLGTRPEYFKAVWVRNEWSRYLTLVKQSGGKKTLIPAYKDMDPYDLPDEFSHLQAQDMSKLGFMQDLIRGIRKLAGADAPKQVVVKETAAPVVTGGTAAAPLLERAFMFLEDGKWTEADEYCEKVLDIEPKNARAYLGKLMAELRVRREDALRDAAQPFDGRDNCVKAARFDPALAKKLAADNAHIRERNEQARLTGIYDGAVRAMNAAGQNFGDREAAYKAAAKQFKSIPGFKDADALAEQCLEKAEVCRKQAICSKAESMMFGEAPEYYENALAELNKIPDWEDARRLAEECQAKIAEIKARRKENRIRAEREAEARRIENEKRKRLFKRAAAIGLPILAAVIVLAVLTVKVFVPLGKYNAAVKLYEDGKYEEAVKAFTALDGYKDSAEKADECLFQKQKAGLSNVAVGATIKFGSYEQDNNPSNGREEIEWKVLAVDGKKTLLISQYALDCKPYNNTEADITWKECTLRTWLNETFYAAAFGPKHQKMIVSSTVTADKNPKYSTSPGSNTTDKVFLLSITEANKYFSSEEARKCAPTEYAKAQEAWTSSNYSVGGKATCCWWLRSPGRNSSETVYVNSDGSVYSDGDLAICSSVSVRPAMWINLA